MEVLDDEDTTTTTAVPPTTAPPTTTTTAPPPPVVRPVPTPAGPDEVVVAPGDSFWSLAEEAVAEGAAVGPVDGYWRRLVALNAPRLVDPGNPDLLYPGQVLLLPPPDA
jgi:nucleoid-associated protein YgaU